MKPKKIIDQVFFPFVEKSGKVQGFIVSKLEDGSYLVSQGDDIFFFTFEQLKDIPQNKGFVILPFAHGSNEFGSPYAMKYETFKTFIDDFAQCFGESVTAGFITFYEFLTTIGVRFFLLKKSSVYRAYLLCRHLGYHFYFFAFGTLMFSGFDAGFAFFQLDRRNRFCRFGHLKLMETE